MKKGKKSRLTLGIILILVLMFVGTTVVAAAGATITWEPETIYAGGDVARLYHFTPPDEIAFYQVMDEPIYDTDNNIIGWNPQATTTYFTKTLDELKEMYATDAGTGPADGMDLKITYKYPSPTKPGETISFQNQSGGDPFSVGHAFLVPQPTFELSLEVQYNGTRPPAWNSAPREQGGIGPDPGRDNFRVFSETNPPITVSMEVRNGQPILSGTWLQTNGSIQNMIEMNNLAMPAGATDIPDPNSPYTLKDKTWHRDGFYVYAAKSVAGDIDPYRNETITVTVYVKDGDKEIDLGSQAFISELINDINGEAIVQFHEYDLPAVPFDGTALSSVKPGVYTLLADTSANVINDATQGQEIGTLTVTGVSKVSVDPASSSVEKGAAQQFTANVDAVESGQHKVSDKTVAWSISGQKSADTKIDPQTGVLTVGFGEPAGNTITVTAESVFDNNGQGKVRGETTATVVEPDHSVTNGTSEIKQGQEGRWEFAGKFANLSRLSLNGTDFTIVPESATRAQLKYPGYKGVAGIAEEGSVKVTLYKEFLATLPAGEYKLEATFDDGGVQNIGSAQFTIVKGKAAPKTGDETDVWLWIALAAAGACILGAAARRKAGKAGGRNE